MAAQKRLIALESEVAEIEAEITALTEQHASHVTAGQDAKADSVHDEITGARERLEAAEMRRGLAIEHVLTLDVDGKPPKDRTESKKRFMKAVAGLVKAFRIASGTPEAEEVKDEVGFFTAVQAAIRKMDAGSRTGRTVEEADLAIWGLMPEGAE